METGIYVYAHVYIISIAEPTGKDRWRLRSA